MFIEALYKALYKHTIGVEVIDTKNILPVAKSIIIAIILSSGNLILRADIERANTKIIIKIVYRVEKLFTIAIIAIRVK